MHTCMPTGLLQQLLGSLLGYTHKFCATRYIGGNDESQLLSYINMPSQSRGVSLQAGLPASLKDIQHEVSDYDYYVG